MTTPSVPEPSNPYRTMGYESSRRITWDEGFAAGRAAERDRTKGLRQALELIQAHARLDLTERGIAEAERYAAIAHDALVAGDLLASSTAEKLATARKHPDSVRPVSGDSPS